MENLIDNDSSTQLRYAVRVNGEFVSPKYATTQQAEAAMLLLSEAQQSIAEVVPVTADGGQLLFG